MARTVVTLEQELNSSRMAFNIARATLASHISGYAKEGAEDRLISSAAEYGLDHTLTQLSSNPFLYDVNRTPLETELEKIRDVLTRAYDASIAMDKTMAEREQVLRKDDKGRPKAFLYEGREVVFDPATNELTDLASNTKSVIEVEYVQPGNKHDNENSNTRSR